MRNYHENGRNMDQYCNGYHRAYDISDTDGAAIPSIADGEVISGTRANGTFGGQVVIMYENLGIQVIYGHVKTPLEVSVGDGVKQGQTIAHQGSTNNQGVNMSSHLHIQFQEIESLGEWEFTCLGIDPLDIDVSEESSNKGSDNVGNAFENLPQLTDMRGKLAENSRWAAPNYQTPISQLERGIHHSATLSTAGGSTTEAFARFHVNSHDWPCIGYKFSIEPHNIVDTPNGKRAVIHYNHSLDIVGYHVGDSNDLSIGILIAGDYTQESLTDEAMASFADLNNALDQDNIAMGGMFPHSAYPGYAWKKCSVYSPSYALETGEDIVGGSTGVEVGEGKEESLPEQYTVQQGDTLYSIASTESFTAQDLQSWNNIPDPTGLKVGQVLDLKNSEGASNEKETPYTVGNWSTNDYGTQWIEAKGTFTVGSEPITMRNGSPKKGAPSPGEAQPGASIEYHELVRVTFNYNAGEGYIGIGYYTGEGGLRYCYTGTWNPITGEVSESWGTFS